MFKFQGNKYHKLSDSELITLYQKDESSAIFTEIYGRYSYLTMGVCLKYLKDEDLAKDLFSKIFEELGAKIVKYEILNFNAWMHRLVKNECLMYLRKSKHYFIPIYELEISEEKVDNIYKEEKYQLLETAINTLNEKQSVAIRYFYLEDKSYQEIAQLMQTDLNTIKSLIQNGKRNLKNTLLQNQVFKDEQN
jgi:RNA polymerase sigma factor (sigma-70 family)